MRNNREYQICKDIAIYLRMQYPNVIFHFDLAGLNLSRAQAGMMKAIQGGRGWPDLFIAEPKEVTEETEYETLITYYNGLFIEVKKEGTILWKARGGPATEHIKEQIDMLNELEATGYKAEFGVGFDDCMKLINDYLK
jgi:hypothetical protein